MTRSGHSHYWMFCKKLFYETVIDRCFTIWSEAELLPQWQFGFRRGFGTDEALLSIASMTEEAERERLNIYAKSQDISKPHDNVERHLAKEWPSGD